MDSRAHPHKFNLEGTPDAAACPGGSIKEAKQTSYFHYFENAGSEELHILVRFNHEMSEDIGLPEAMAGIPEGTPATTLHPPDSQVFSTFSTSHDLIAERR